MRKESLIFVILIVFVWAGMILGISFLEAPLKFQAPDVTLPIGLGIGRIVFTALNQIEIIFCLSILSILFFLKTSLSIWIFISSISLILFAQTLWLLPVLDQRAGIIISGGIPTGNSPHIFYVIAEIIKMITLLSMGYTLVNNILENKKIIYP